MFQINTVIQPGEMVVLLGRSGSGKTTLLNLISGIDHPSSGQVVFNQTNLTELSERKRTLFRRQHIGFVFQSFNLIPTLTVLENILLPLELNNELTPSDRQHALHLLSEVNLENRASSFPDRLSGGEQQRVTIARALAHHPLLVLADEPTGNLDYETGQEVMTLMNRLVQKSGHTLLIATHDRDMLERADRVFELKKGQLEELSPDDLPG